MLIEFVKNPQFQPPAPAIRVGSVVSYRGHKVVVVDKDDSRSLYRVSPWKPHIGSWFAGHELEAVPERVSGWDENGPQFSPIDPPPQEFSWSDYPPRAGMVVQHIDGQKPLYVLFQYDNTEWTPVNMSGDAYLGTRCTTDLMAYYRPRPDLMPRFVEQKP